MMSRRDLLALPALGIVHRFARPSLALGLGLDDPDPTRVFTGQSKPTDVRLGPPKTYNDYFPFTVPKSKDAWEARKAQLREQLLVANGLWPLPEKTPLNAVVHGKVEKDGYSIEKVFFASTPGHYVCGNLYRPVASGGRKSPDSSPFPAVLFAHGHWANGRFHDAGEKAAAASVKSGGEPDLERGRWFMQAIPITLARHGFVVFQYDMIGYADSTALTHREGFKDAEADLRLQSFMGLQTWNSIRALDFIASLKDVDPKRIGMTGASGGGTQTFITAALDDRLAAAFPAVMVSTAMQGGCVCENCSYLRVSTGNIEIAAMFAPKPQALSAANDWTKDLMTKGFPELKQLYALYGAEDKVAARAWLEYGHQYNVHAREFMYAWFNKHLQGKDAAIKEAAYQHTPPAELRVFDAEHPRPKDELNAPKLREAMAKVSDAQLKALEPKDAKSLAEFQRVVGGALRVMVQSNVPTQRGYRIMLGGTNLGMPLPGNNEGIKGVFSWPMDDALQPEKPSDDNGERIPFFDAWSIKDLGNEKPWVIWLHPKGKSSVMEKGEWVPAAKKMLESGLGLCAVDLLHSGEQRGEKQFPVDKNYAGYTYGYNRTLVGNRVRDVLSTVAFIQRAAKAKSVYLLGFGEMGPVAVLAKALAGDKVAKLAADLNQFRFENIKDTSDPMMLPGAAKYGGLGAMLALCAPAEVLAHNHKGTASGQLAQMAYAAAGAKDKLTRANEKLDDLKVVEWLVK